MSERTRHALAGVLWMAIAQALFAVMNVSARLVGSDVPWQEVCGSRMLVGAVVAFAVAKARGKSLAIVDKKHAWLRSIFGTASAAGTFYVLARPEIAVGDAVTLFATSPIFVVLLSWPLLAERVGLRTAFVVLLAFAGIVVVAQPSFASAGGVVAIGTLTAMGSAVAMIWLRRIGPGESGEAIVFHFMCVGTVAMLFASIPTWRTPDTRSLLFLAMTGAAGGLAQLAMTRAYSLDRAARISAVGYTGVVFTRAISLPLFGEQPTMVQIAGSALVIGSGVALALSGRERIR